MDERGFDHRIRKVEALSRDHGVSFEEAGGEGWEGCKDASDGADITEEVEVVDDSDWASGRGEDAGYVDDEIED